MPVSIGSVRKERVLTVEWLKDKLADAGGTIPHWKGPIALTLHFATPPQSLSKRARNVLQHRETVWRPKRLAKSTTLGLKTMGGEMIAVFADVPRLIVELRRLPVALTLMVGPSR